MISGHHETTMRVWAWYWLSGRTTPCDKHTSAREEIKISPLKEASLRSTIKIYVYKFLLPTTAGDFGSIFGGDIIDGIVRIQ